MQRSIFVLFIFLMILSAECGKESSKRTEFKNKSHSVQNESEKRKSLDPFQTICVKDRCSTFVLLNNGKKIFVAFFPIELSKKMISMNIASLTISCGSPCSYKTFVDLNSGKISKPFFLVLAVDTINQNIAYCDSSFLVVSTLFDSVVAPLKIKRPFSPSATPFTVVDSAYFNSSKHFVFRYLAGKGYTETWDSILVN